MNKDKDDAVAQGTPSLVERLRAQSEVSFGEEWNEVGKLDADAADRIEALEAEVAALSAQVVELRTQTAKECAHIARTLMVQVIGESPPVRANADWIADEIEHRFLHSSVTRASVPPSVKDSGT